MASSQACPLCQGIYGQVRSALQLLLVDFAWVSLSPPARVRSWLSWCSLCMPVCMFIPACQLTQTCLEVRAFQVALVVKIPPAFAGGVRDAGSIPGLERAPGGGHCNPLQCSCLEIPWTEEPGGLQSMGLQRVGYN